MNCFSISGILHFLNLRHRLLGCKNIFYHVLTYISIFLCVINDPYKVILCVHVCGGCLYLCVCVGVWMTHFTSLYPYFFCMIIWIRYLQHSFSLINNWYCIYFNFRAHLRFNRIKRHSKQPFYCSNSLLYWFSDVTYMCVYSTHIYFAILGHNFRSFTLARNYMEFCATKNFKNLQSSSRDLRELHTFQLMTKKNCRKNRAQKQSTTKQSFQFNGWNLEQITMERKTWPSSWIMKPIAVVQQQFEYAKSH